MNDEKFKGVDVISVYLWIHQTDLVNQFMEAILNAHYKPGVVWEGLGPAEIPLQAVGRCHQGVVANVQCKDVNDNIILTDKNDTNALSIFCDH